MTQDPLQLQPADWAIDTNPSDGPFDPDDPDRLLVVGAPNETAGEHTVFEEPSGATTTVADLNDDCSTDEPVLEAVYEPDLLEFGESLATDLTVSLALDLHKAGTLDDQDGLTVYSFPRSRLSVADDAPNIPRTRSEVP